MIKQRNTVQRQIILETLKKFHTHPTVEEVYTEIYKKHPTISKATVYRNLRQLTARDEVRLVSLPGGVERYDGDINQHYHFKCKVCSDVLDVNVEYLTDINETVQQQYGFQVDGHDVVFKGVCSKCGDIRK